MAALFPLMARLQIGTAGWSIPRAVAGAFAESGSALERYAGRFEATEINSSFHRAHRPTTYERWGATTPADFRFAVKMPKAITHQRRLVDVEGELARFLDEIAGLGAKLGPILLQLPPSLVFDAAVVGAFLDLLRARWTGPLACEPRHPTWFKAAADTLLREHGVARAAADPACVPEAADPAGWPGLRYIRLHGSPRMYYSPYDDAYLAALEARLAASDVETWCIFDNTASGAACANALELLAFSQGNGEDDRRL